MSQFKRNFDELSLLDDFKLITGIDDDGIAINWLEVSNYCLDDAVQMYYAHSQEMSQILDTSNPIREPDKPKRQRLLTENEKQFARSSRKPASSFSSSGKISNPLSKLYQIPVEMMEMGTFEQVRNTSKLAGKWMLVNIQKDTEFLCHELNRDFWSDQGVKEMIAVSFVFWQQLDVSEEGKQFINYYGVKDFPHISILDPITGAVKWRQEKMKISLLAEKLQDFIGMYPSPVSQSSSENYSQSHKTSQNFDEMVVEPLDSTEVNPLDSTEKFPSVLLGFNANAVLQLSSNQFRNQEESEALIKLKFKMPNGHTFIRSFNSRSSIMFALLEITKQISTTEYNKYFDVYYDHPQKSLFQVMSDNIAWESRDCLLQKIHGLAMTVNFDSVGIRRNMVMMVRFNE